MTAARRLAAILAADVVGYSRLMGEDEAGTARAVREHREAARPIVAGFGGRIVKTTGDGVLLEFPSVVAAVECAIAIQKLMVERNAGTPEAKRIVYRIGVNLGDVLIDGDDILGDGVNIAARLEGICEPGGVLISGSAYDHVRGRIDAEFVDLGEKDLKNIARPVRAYAIATGSESAAAAPVSETPKLSTDHPSLAVLPFTCFSEEREFKYLTEAMTGDLITILARIPGFIVIARQSSFAYQGRAIDSRQIGRELGVRYIVEGSLRPAGPQIRVGAQLIDAATGAQLWADRFDRQPENVLELQDQIARAIAGRIEPELVRAEIALIGAGATPAQPPGRITGRAPV